MPFSVPTALRALAAVAVCWNIGACTQGARKPSRATIAAATTAAASQASPVAAPLLSSSVASAAAQNPAPTPPPSSGVAAHADDLRQLRVASGKRTAKSIDGMVSSVEAHATRAGVAVLDAGGNAVDAAVAVAFALAVTHPSAGNLGGGGFMLIKMHDQPTVALDFREQAPQAVTQAAFRRMIARRGLGSQASGIPGSVAGLDYALQHFGTQSRATVLQAAIRLAADGHPLGERQALVLGWAWPLLSKDPEAARIFGNGRRALRQGEMLRQPELAKTLADIARSGAEGFYGGTFAKQLVRLTARSDTPIVPSELATYRARPRAPLRTRYRQLEVEVAPPPSAGGVAVVEMLAMLEHEHAYELGQDSVAALHLFAEVAKRAHADRRFRVVDPDSVTGYDAAAHLARWTNPLTWLQPFPIQRTQTTPASLLDPLYAAAVKELDHTTHFSVVDRAGNVVSCTTTLSASFGAKYVVPGTGVVMNNSLGAFGTVGQDVLQPGRRMTSSMTPTIVSDRDGPILILGSPGGDTIPNTVVQVLRNLTDYSMSLDQAVDEPRVHHGFVPDAIRTERLRPLASSVRSGLVRLGHTFTQPSRTIGDANNIVRTPLGWEGYADPREGGLALGPSP